MEIYFITEMQFTPFYYAQYSICTTEVSVHEGSTLSRLKITVVVNVKNLKGCRPHMKWMFVFVKENIKELERSMCASWAALVFLVKIFSS